MRIKKFLEISNKLNISNDFHNRLYGKCSLLYEKSACINFTSLWEDPGFVLVETGYNNCQVISNNCPNGPVEIIGNDGGYLFKSNSKKVT